MKMMMTIMALTMVVMMTMPTNCILTLPDCCGWALPVQVHFAKIARVKKGNQAVGPIRTDSLSSPSNCTHYILSWKTKPLTKSTKIKRLQVKTFVKNEIWQEENN